MLNFQIKTREIISRKGNFGCNTFIYKPENIEETALGVLFIVGEVNKNNAANKEYFYIINQVASRMKKEYYSRNAQGPYKNFQEAIKKINSFLTQFANKKDSSDTTTINIIIAAQTGKDFYFTTIGKPKIFLLRGEYLWEIDKKLLPGKNPSPDKTFVNIASGQLILGDMLLLTSSNFIEIFLQKILKETLENNDFEKIHKYISEIISNDKSLEPCGAILIELIQEKGVAVRYSYEEMRKINHESANQKTTAAAPTDQNSTAHSKKDGLLARLKNICKFSTLTKTIMERFISYLSKIILRKFILAKNVRLKNQIVRNLKNRKKIIIIFSIISLIALLTLYLFRQESVIFIK